jgi:hypothetical protein
MIILLLVSIRINYFTVRSCFISCFAMIDRSIWHTNKNAGNECNIAKLS